MSSDGGHRLFLEIEDETARRAVAPEADEAEGEKASIGEDGVTVEVDDVRELRAALNGWTRLVSVASDRRLQP
jgi:tRNA threonylcarbamoyladenosine modification (KEOPS) complex  Pcc1 subunit